MTSNKYRVWCKKNLKNYVNIFITSDFTNLFKRDVKNIYKNKKMRKNTVGFGIKCVNPVNVNLFINNNSSKE